MDLILKYSYINTYLVQILIENSAQKYMYTLIDDSLSKCMQVIGLDGK